MTDQTHAHAPEAPEAVQESTPETPATGNRRRWIIVGAAAAAAAAGIGVFALLSGSSPEPRLQNAFDACAGTDGMEYVTVSDGGKAIVIDTEASYNDVAGAACVLVEVDTPEYVSNQIASTNALMGVQNADANDYEYAWSYHPDNGMNMTIIDTRFDS